MQSVKDLAVNRLKKMKIKTETEIYKSRLLNMTESEFEETAFRAFHLQARYNETYRFYLQCLKRNPKEIKRLEDIPFMPIEFFKTQKIKTGNFEEKIVFLSSGTTKQERSKHLLSDGDFYNEISRKIFTDFYGDFSGLRIVALLPSYLEQGNSSLVYMIENFLPYSKENSFFSLNFDEVGRELEKNSKDTIVFGVSYALIDFAEKYKAKDAVCIETGGTKGRRREMTKEELHEFLRPAFREIHSEYGMTELLSQSYAVNSTCFTPGYSLRVFLRNMNDPFDISSEEKYGGLNIIDLANIESCCFIETKDIARITGKQFEILGRYDFSDLRGCNLMLS